MGVDLGFGFFVDDKVFVPTKQQLIGIAALLEEAGVVDSTEREILEQKMNATYSDDEGPLTTHGNEEISFSYKLTGPKSFPVFNSSNEYGKIDAQYMQIYQEPRCMDPMSGDLFTRFVIAEVHPNPYWGADWLDEVETQIEENSVLVFLQTQIKSLLGTFVTIAPIYA